MRFLIIVKASAESEAGVMPGEELIQRMTAFHEELAKAGALLDGAGLQPSSAGWRVEYQGDQRRIVRGPFPADGNLVAGYTLIQARTPEEAMEWTRRFPNPQGEGRPTHIEVRPLMTFEEMPACAGMDRSGELSAGR